VDQEVLDRMTDTLEHRGPDGRGVFIDENVGLGHRRLSIIDLSSAGAQPMRSSDGNFTITYNGEIYNFKEERENLEKKGHSFKSKCDTEVLLALYQEYGVDCLKHLRGMFAFAIYDKNRQRIFCARDRMGQKPFKYFFDGKTFLFASELKALLKNPSCPKDIDRESINHFLTMMYLPAPMTGFKGIQKLEAGHSLILDLKSKSLKKEKYWDLDMSQEEPLSEKEWKDKILEALQESVNLRMISDVPIAAYLSGGIDSGAVVSLMSKISQDPVKTFSIGSAIDTHNELPDALNIAKHVGSDHNPYVVTPDIVKLLPELVKIYEEPYGDASSVPTYYISEHTSRQVKVALTGDGGDENFAGYIRYPILNFSRRWEKFRLIHPLVRAGTSLFHSLAKNTFSYRCHRFQSTMHLPWERRYLQYLSYFTEEEKNGLGVGLGLGRTDEFYKKLTEPARQNARDTLHAAMRMDHITYLADDLMPKVDLASMHFGLECRAPFLDHKLLELTAKIPSKMKLRGREGKVILKKALEGVLPQETLQKKKSGFRIPLDNWFRNDLKDFVTDRLLSDTPHKWDFFEKSKVEKMLKGYFDTRIDYSDHIWALLWLDEWFSL